MNPLIYLALASAREHDLRAAAHAGRAASAAHAPRAAEVRGEPRRPAAPVAVALRPRNS